MTKFQLSRWLPKTLYARLILTIMVSMSLMLAGFAIYTAYRDQQIVLKNAESQISAMAFQVAASSVNYLIVDNYAELEELAIRFLEYPAVDFINIYSTTMEPLAAVQKQIGESGQMWGTALGKNLPVPTMLKKPFLVERHMEIWYPVESGEMLAWLHIRYNLNDSYERIQAIWINISVVLILTLLIALFGIRSLLRTNIKRLDDATVHAKHLIAGDGAQLDSRGLTAEVKDLVTALNEVSLALYDKGYEAKRSDALLNTIFDTQQDFISRANAHVLFTNMLDNLLNATQSEFGFIGEVLYTETEQPYLKTHAISNIAWNTQTEELYERQSDAGFEFYNLHSLFGEVILTAKPLVSNDPSKHPKSAGLPTGHPPLNAFLGLPFFSGNEMVGLIGIANRSGGYSEEDIEFLRPLQTTCGQIVEAYRNEHKRAETESRLQESENMLRQVLNNIPTRVFWKDLDGVYLGCNYNFAQDAGFASEKEVIGNSDYQMPWKTEAASYRHDDKIVINNGIPRLKYEEVQTTSSGERVWLRTNKLPLRNVDETIIGILGSYDDISAEKNKEMLVRESESRLAVAQHIAQVGSWEWHVASEENIWSEETFRILGMDPKRKDISFADLYKAIHKDEAQAIQTLIDEKTVLKQPYDYEARIHTYDGLDKVIAVRAQFDFDEEGEISRIYGTMQDITERKRMEKMKDDFISTVSHELRTPLTSIKGSLGLLNNMLSSSSEAKMVSLLSIAQNNTDRLLFLINDILDISKIESGHIVFHFQPLDLVALTEEAISNNSSYANDVSLNFVDPPDHCVWVNADRDRLLQVVYNLLSNAAKFSTPGGVVDISIHEGDGKVLLSVQDYGVGIAKDFIPQLYEKFTQADSSSSRSAGGTGLGLSISKTIVERHNGSIEVASEIGKGSTFSVALPLLHVINSDPDDVIGQGPFILICEDDPDVALLLKEMLVEEGYSCDVANNADQAKKMLYRKQYDAMTLDIMLPGKDGISLLKELRQLPQFEDLNVIIVSVTAAEAHADLEGSALGVSDWLSKPIDEARLLSVMHKLVNEKLGELPRILHVEDDLDLVRIVTSLLDNVAEIDHAGTLKQAISLLQSTDFDLILLDLNLPDGDGLDLIHELQTSCPDVPVVIFSSEEVNMDTVEQVKAVLLKSRVDNTQLVQTIHKLIPSARKPGHKVVI